MSYAQHGIIMNSMYDTNTPMMLPICVNCGEVKNNDMCIKTYGGHHEYGDHTTARIKRINPKHALKSQQHTNGGVIHTQHTAQCLKIGAPVCNHNTLTKKVKNHSK